MKKSAFLILMLIAFVVSGCSSQNKDEVKGKVPAQRQQAVAKKEMANPLLTKEGMEKKLRELGVTVYPQAVFNNVHFKYNNYTIVYDISPATHEMNNKVDEYYNNLLKKLEESGWKKTTISSSMHSYSRGDETFSWAHAFNAQKPLNRIIFTYSKK